MCGRNEVPPIVGHGIKFTTKIDKEGYIHYMNKEGVIYCLNIGSTSERVVKG